MVNYPVLDSDLNENKILYLKEHLTKPGRKDVQTELTKLQYIKMFTKYTYNLTKWTHIQRQCSNIITSEATYNTSLNIVYYSNIQMFGHYE